MWTERNQSWNYPRRRRFTLGCRKALTRPRWSFTMYVLSAYFPPKHIRKSRRKALGTRFPGMFTHIPLRPCSPAFSEDDRLMENQQCLCLPAATAADPAQSQRDCPKPSQTQSPTGERVPADAGRWSTCWQCCQGALGGPPGSGICSST